MLNLSEALSAKAAQPPGGYDDGSAAVRQRLAQLTGQDDVKAGFAALQAAGRLGELRDVLPLGEQVRSGAYGCASAMVGACMTCCSRLCCR